MIAEQPPLATAALHWLPEPPDPPRELQPPVDAIATMLDWLADEGFHGIVVVQSGVHELALLLIEGAVVGASLQASTGLRPLHGAAALRGLLDRAGPAASSRARLLALPRPQVECLTATLDPQPTTRTLNGAEQLREVLRELAGVGHHGVADLIVGQRWGRTLFHHGRLLGAYHSDIDSRAVAPSLATLGRLVTAGPATLYVRTVPGGTLPRLHWPTATSAAPAEAAAASEGEGADEGAARTQAAARTDPARDERVETNLLWLLSHVERDRDRAEHASDREARVLAVLAQFTNAMYSFATQLAASSRRPTEPPRLPAVAEAWRARVPLVAELEWRRGEIDAAALGRRYQTLPREGSYSADFYREMTRLLLCLVQQAAAGIIQEIGEPTVRLRCMSALETWLGSVEGAASPTEPPRG
jgi:hypothetical protein